MTTVDKPHVVKNTKNHPANVFHKSNSRYVNPPSKQTNILLLYANIYKNSIH